DDPLVRLPLRGRDGGRTRFERGLAGDVEELEGLGDAVHDAPPDTVQNEVPFDGQAIVTRVVAVDEVSQRDDAAFQGRGVADRRRSDVGLIAGRPDRRGVDFRGTGDDQAVRDDVVGEERIAVDLDRMQWSAGADRIVEERVSVDGEGVDAVNAAVVSPRV